MITDLLIGFLYSITDTILSALFSSVPDASLPVNITSAILTAGTYWSAFDFILPTDTILTIFGLLLSIEGAILLYKAIMWLVRKIPTIN